ncbi:MAG: RNA-processing protein [Euryarchaeota archaeon]|nr:RNA-processing protein [Euryarchaeota archaeon]|tara:strand:- start:1964 stop:2710 length:747 start_codon:yes stop_codon:yes gene_type:complete
MSAGDMQSSLKIPKKRIAMIIGKGGDTKRMLIEKSGCKSIFVDSNTGDVTITWGEPGTFDPLMMMKVPDMIKAIGRGMNPKKAMSLLDDEMLFELIELKSFVGKKANQQRRIRSRIIGSEGKIRKRLEALTNCEITVYGGTVVIIGDDLGLPMASDAIKKLLNGAEHGPVLKRLELIRKKQRITSKYLDSIHTKEPSSGFEHLVPGLSDVAERRNRRYKNSQPDINNEEDLSELMELSDDETIDWAEE